MPESQRLQRLRVDIERLRNTLLPNPFSATGEYDEPEQVQLTTIAFRLFVHAEVETYVEDRAKELFDCAWACWYRKRVVSRTVLSLLAFSGKQMRAATETAGTLDDAVQQAQSVFRDKVKANNGIKKENILKLFLPLGIDRAQIDPALLGDLGTLGKRRGEAAHQGTGQLQTQIDPRSEYQHILNVMSGLSTLDNQIDEAIAEVYKYDALHGDG